MGLSSFWLFACFFPFGRGNALHRGPLALRVRLDSATASAYLSWERAPGAQFRYYEVQRAAGEAFEVLDRLEGREDTSYVDSGLEGNRLYRYRVTSYFGAGDEKELHSLGSSVAEGEIHRLSEVWNLPPGFLPTRLVVGARGVLAAVGVGTGRVARFDPSGRALEGWEFTSEPLARLETGVLDGPTLALDSHDNLYVIYNLLRPGRAPEAFWSKFDAGGEPLWTHPLEGLFVRHIAIDGEDHIFVESISQLQQFDPGGERRARHRVPALLVSSLHFWGGRFAALVEPLQFVEGGWQAPRLVVYSGVERQEMDEELGRDPLSEEDSGSGLLRRPSDFVVDEELGRVFVVNAGQYRIEVFRRGRFLTRWGARGEAEGRFDFSGSAEVLEDLSTGATAAHRVVAGGIARDRQGYLYVADTFNNRIQKFQP